MSHVDRSGTHSARLLLCVHHADGHVDELYLAQGLTIGRTMANTVVLADDEVVERMHARVEILEDGSAKLTCLDSAGAVRVGEAVVRELPLTDGLVFTIGKTRFQCIGGRVEPQSNAPGGGQECPLCRGALEGTSEEGLQRCPHCSQLLIAVRLEVGDSHLVALPAQYGEFRAETFVARGGMGIVLRGKHESSREPVAIKLIRPGGLATQAADRFKQEVAMMARVLHPNVVRLISYGQTNAFNYLVMEWIEGTTLREVMQTAKQRGQLIDFTTAYGWFQQVCKGLAAIHAAGVIHRDLKPGNLLIDRKNQVRIADLGIAKGVDEGSATMTMTGQVPGTYEYMSPEQRENPSAVDQRTDQFSLGMTFYELLTGNRPAGAWAPASTVNRTVPAAFDMVLARLMAHKVGQRYDNVQGAITVSTPEQPRGPTPAPLDDLLDSLPGSQGKSVGRAGARPKLGAGPRRNTRSGAKSVADLIRGTILKLYAAGVSEYQKRATGGERSSDRCHVTVVEVGPAKAESSDAGQDDPSSIAEKSTLERMWASFSVFEKDLPCIKCGLEVVPHGKKCAKCGSTQQVHLDGVQVFLFVGLLLIVLFGGLGLLIYGPGSPKQVEPYNHPGTPTPLWEFNNSKARSDALRAQRQAQEAESKWKLLSSAENKYEIAFPGVPTVADNGGHSYSLEALEGKGACVYYIDCLTRKAAIDLSDSVAIRKQMDSFQRSLVDSLKGELITSIDSTSGEGKYPARDVFVDFPRGNGISHTRYVFTGVRFYRINVVGPKEFVDSADAKRFFESFRVLE